MTKKSREKDSESIFDKLGEKFDHKLVKTTPLKNLPVDLRKVLTDLYSAKEFRARRVFAASVINGMFTEQITEFLMSQNLLTTLVSNDPNVSRKAINSQDYKEFYAYLVKKEFIEITEQPGRWASGEKAKAGRWRWVERGVLRLLSQYWTEDGSDPDDEYESLSNTPSGLPKVPNKNKLDPSKSEPSKIENMKSEGITSQEMMANSNDKPLSDAQRAKELKELLKVLE